MQQTFIFRPSAILLLILTFFLSAMFSGIKAQSIAINEIMASNATTIADEDGDYEDWIELHNFGTVAVPLNLFGLSDNPNEPFRWLFPDVVIQPGQFMIVWASGKNRTDPNAPLHTNFSIKAEGEPVLLTNPSGFTVNMIQPVVLQSDISYGRSPDGTGMLFFFAEPTPGSENNTQTYSEILAPPVFSRPGGFYTEDFTLTLSHPDPAVSIYYTLDGSVPDLENLDGTIYFYKNQYPENPGDPFGELIPGSYSSHLYSEPFAIHDCSPEPDSITHISSTWHQLPYYFPVNPVFKGTVVRALAVKPGAISSAVQTNTYFITAAGNDRYSLPVVSLSIPRQLFFDYEDGIYVAGIDYDNWRSANPQTPNTWGTVCNFDRRGDEWELRSHMEFFDPASNHAKLSQEVGIRIHGSEARRRPMKSLRIYARGQYGKTELNHRFFNSLTDASFKRILLRNSGQDFLSTMMRDATLHTMAKGLNVATQAYTPSVVFLNGEYWGIHNIRERYDKYYLQRTYGVDPENIDYLSANEINEGDTMQYHQTISYIKDNGLVEDVHYQYIKTRIDVENFMDYQITNIYANNIDWPGANLEYWRLRTTDYVPGAPYGHDGRWRWLLYDMDFSFGLAGGCQAATHNMLAFATLPGGTSYPNPDWSTLLLRKFLENNEFKTRFINRFADLMNTYFTPERVIAVINEQRDRIAPEMPEHLLRWNTYAHISTWCYFLQEMGDFATLRPEYQRQHIREHFGIESDISVELNVSNPAHGHIRINTIEITGDTPGVSDTVYPWTGIYFKGIPLELEAIPAPGYEFCHWEGLPEGSPALVQIIPDTNLNVKACFIKTGEPQLIYFWLFDTSLPNDTPLQQIEATFDLTGEASIQFHSALAGYPFYSGHPSWRKASMERRNAPTEINYRSEANNGIPYAASNMRGLQIKQPFTGSGGENIMTFHVPSSDYQDLVFRFAAKDEGAAEYLLPEYSVAQDEPVWIPLPAPGDTLSLSTVYQLFEINFQQLDLANNNPDFKIRIRFGGSNMSADLGKRVTFNNFSLDGKIFESINEPPVVVNPPGLYQLTESGSGLTVDLNEIFSDPDNNELIFSAVADTTLMASFSINGSLLTIQPVQQGGIVITLIAYDGQNPPVSTTLRVLIYPEPHVLKNANYSFLSWDENEPEYSYPPHMLFLQTDVSDPGLNEPLLFPYYIPHNDYHADDQGTIGFPYNNTGRTRINGLGNDGISFINTGRSRDLGGALLALDTRGITSARLNWLGGTLLQNSRVYAIRLQYRTDHTQGFTDFTINGQPLEYIAGNDGEIHAFESIQLPAEMLGQENIHLLWKYYFVSGDSGPRAKLRLDDIFFSDILLSNNELLKENISVYYSQGSVVIQMPFETEGTINIFDATGRTILSDQLSGSLSHRISARLPKGLLIVQVVTRNQVFVKKIIAGF